MLRERFGKQWLSIGAAAIALALCAFAPWREAASQTSASTPASDKRPTVDTSRRLLPRIKPGTVIDNGPPKGWSHLVLLARPRVARGDVESVSPEVIRYGSMFLAAIVANVRAEEHAGHRTYVLDQVATGLAMDIRGQVVVVTSGTQASLGADLGYIGEQVLAGAEQVLNDVVQVARTPHLLVFDAWSTVLHDGRHQRMAVRHAVLVDEQTGELSTLAWLLAPAANGELKLVKDEMHLLPRNLQEDRILNVRADNLIVGLLTGRRDGFALVNIPPGEPLKIAAGMQPLARSRFAAASDATSLEAALKRAASQGK